MVSHAAAKVYEGGESNSIWTLFRKQISYSRPFGLTLCCNPLIAQFLCDFSAYVHTHTYLRTYVLNTREFVPLCTRLN